jgi:signal peptidase I
MKLKSIFDRRNTTSRVRGERRAEDTARIVEGIHACKRIALRVHGTSMLPWVRPHDIAIIRRATLDDIRCGDVVLFRRNDRLFVHRIVEKRGSLDATQFIAKGDAHRNSDGHVEESELLGRLVRLYRSGRHIDLETPRHLALGVLIAQLSQYSRAWYPFVRFAAILTRPGRRIWWTE